MKLKSAPYRYTVLSPKAAVPKLTGSMELCDVLARAQKWMFINNHEPSGALVIAGWISLVVSWDECDRSCIALNKVPHLIYKMLRRSVFAHHDSLTHDLCMVCMSTLKIGGGQGLYLFVMHHILRQLDLDVGWLLDGIS
jgi:hypothetical protein